MSKLTAFLRVVGAALLLVFTLAAKLQAQAPKEDPAPALVATINGVLDLAAGQTPDTIDQRVGDIRAKMNERFATDAIVQRAFGRNWAKMSAAQQKEVIDLLGRLIIRTYAVQLAANERPKISILSSKQISPDRREITSTASSEGKTVNIVYRLAPIDGVWKVYDVIAENVSVVSNYRQQFDSHFEKKTADDLIQTLRAKVAAPVQLETPKT